MTLPMEIIDEIFLNLPHNVLEYTREIQSEWVKTLTKYDTIEDAILDGNKYNIIWLMDRMYPCDCYTFEKAVKVFDLEFLKTLRSRGCPWDEHTFLASISRGDISIIKWLLDIGCPYSNISYELAVKKGNLDILCMLQPLWEEWTMYTACLKGDLNLIKWLYNRGCPWNEYTLMGAILNGKRENIEWLKKTLR